MAGELRASAGAAGDLCGPATVCRNHLQSGELVVSGPHQGLSPNPPGYSTTAQSPKMVFVKPLQANARALLSRPILEPLSYGAPKIMLSAEQMRSLPDFFAEIPDPRRAQGRRHPLPTVLAIAAGATLCGMRGYKAIADWAKSLGPKARERFGCRSRNKGAASCRVNTSFAMSSSASIRWSSTVPCSAGTNAYGEETKASPSTARRCATPSTSRAIRPTS